MRDILVDDDLDRPLYKDSRKGRPSLPPSLVVLTMLLQYHDDCSGRETEARVRFHLRWKHALGLDLQETGFDATVLSAFHRKLIKHNLTRVLFDRLIAAAREAGLLTRTADQVIDSSHILGAAGVRDTYTLIRGGIRKLLRALGYIPSRIGSWGNTWAGTSIRRHPRSPSWTGAIRLSGPSICGRWSRMPERPWP